MRTQTQDPPRLIADAMLGKLARWLRMLGYDTLYMHADDHAIAQRSRAEGRILLTQDQGLATRRGLQTILIHAQKLESQLDQVIQEVGPLPPKTPGRCMQCNLPLESITPEEALQHIPPYIAQTQQAFHRCPKCGKITWSGTHWDAIKARLKRLQSHASQSADNV